MTTTDTTAEVCTICRHTRAEHAEREFKHAFSPPGGKTGGLFKKTDASEVMAPPPGGALRKLPPGDPVLRMALIRLGVVTVEALEQVEAELRATGMSFGEPPTPVA